MSSPSVEAVPSQPSTSTSTADSAQNARKRRRATTLTRIELGAPQQAAPTHTLGGAKLSTLSGSNESLNSNASDANAYGALSSGASSGANSDDELPAAGAPSSSRGGSPPTVGGWDKRARLVSSNEQQPAVSAPAAVDVHFDLAELECSQDGSASATSAVSKARQSAASGGLCIAGGEFELVGDGRECKAVHRWTGAVWHCQVMKPSEYKSFLAVVARLAEAERLFADKQHFERMKALVVPDSTRALHEANGLHYVLTEDHHGNLHSLHCPTAGAANCERRVQPIFRQIVQLVAFCHRMGVYFRDFRLRKFVFVDAERRRIRLSSALDLWLSSSVDDDRMASSRTIVPYYVAPEFLHTARDASSAFRGRPADTWALGILLFTLLTGKYPFIDGNPSLLCRRIKGRRFSYPLGDGVSKGARWLVHALLRPDPAERPAADEILHSHWLQMAAEQLSDGKVASAARQAPSAFSQYGVAPAFVRASTRPLATVLSAPRRRQAASLQQTLPAAAAAPLAEAPDDHLVPEAEAALCVLASVALRDAGV